MRRLVIVIVVLLAVVIGIGLERRFQVHDVVVDRARADVPEVFPASVAEAEAYVTELIAHLRDRYFAQPAQQHQLETGDFSGRVVKVIDGDSLEIVGDGIRYEVRLGQIDAPEWNQPWGKQAKVALENKIGGSRVRVQVSDIDRYDRMVANVFLDDRHINEELVAEGYAWVYRRYLHDRSLLTDEREAQRLKLGLWGDAAEPIPPWKWRR